MKCPCCGSDQLFGIVTLQRAVPLAHHGGSVKIGGVERVNRLTLKEEWDKDKAGRPRELRGPIFCAVCESEMFYVSGAPINPILGSYQEALQLGPEHYRRKA
jgi:hypothetical protein